MVILNENENLMPSIKMAVNIFESMGVDISNIYSISIEKRTESLKLNEGSTGKALFGGEQIFIFILSDLDFETFIKTFAHEVGHATQICGLFKDEKRSITGVIAESIALKFEKEFLIKFNEEYDTNISINAVYNGFNRYSFAHYVKKLMILKTKSEYKLI